MRTKVLVGIAALAASALTTVAQNVYSLNVVGYINLSLSEGFNLVANQLDADGQGTNNTVLSVLGTNVPGNTAVWTWTGTAYAGPSTFTTRNKVWTIPNMAVNPGQGFWVLIPTGAGATTITTVGQVLQGPLVNPNIPAAGGFTILSSIAPLAGGLQTALGYTPTGGDQVFVYQNGAYALPYTYSARNHNWGAAGEPQIAVGQGFWLNAATAGQSWSNYFIVQ